MGKFELIIEPGRQDIIIRREFDAPRDVVFAAFMDPALIPNWWGPRRYSTIVDHMEPRAGGSWRFLNRDADGNEFAFRGVFHTVNAPESLVQTFEFEPFPGHVSLDSATFEEHDGRTLMVSASVFQSVEDRDQMVADGMEGGVRESYERLDDMLAEILARA